MAQDTSSTSSLSPVLVTGGCGFIGSHIVRHLRTTDPSCIIHVLDINTARNRVDGAIYHTGDISIIADVESVFDQVQPKVVFHTACPDSMRLQPSVFRHVNLVGSLNLVNAAQAAGTQAFINTTTSSIIHDNRSDIVNADETYPILEYPQQKRVYSLTKAEAHKQIMAANRAKGDASLLTASILPAPTFGTHDEVLTNKMAANAKAGKANIQIGPGNNWQDFIYVSNLVDGHILVAQALVNAYGEPAPADDVRVDGEAFLFTNDERVEFWEFSRSIAAAAGYPVKPDDIKIIPIWVAWLFAAIRELTTWVLTFGKRIPIVTREAVQLTTITKTFSCEKAKRVLGYKPKVSLEEGLQIVARWMRENETASKKSN